MSIPNSQAPTSKVTIVPGRNIIRSEATGVWTVDLTISNRNEVMEMGSKFKGKKWGFMGIIANMAPIVDANVSKEFAKFHDELDKVECTAVAFVVGSAVAIKAQSKRHQDTSNASGQLVNHFKTEEQALEWFKSLGI